MRKIEKRSIFCLILAALLGLGLAFFCFQFVVDGGDWASYPYNRHLYNNSGQLKGGTILDRDGDMLSTLDEDGNRIYNDDAAVRRATLHAVGDKNGNIGAGALTSFADKLSGYNLLTGVYSPLGTGNSLYLTIDAYLNNIAYQALNGMNGTVGVYNYKTGEILCMVSTPTFDPANPPDIAADDPAWDGVYVNRLLSANSIPGSIFKVVTINAAIENIPDLFQRKWTCTGSVNIGGEEVTCPHAHGEQDIEEALANSCNGVFGQLAVELGGETMQEYADAAGLTKSIKVDGIQSSVGKFDFSGNDNQLAWSGVGQGQDTLCPINMLQYMGAIANGGKAAVPRLIEKSTTDYGLPTGIYYPHKSAQLIDEKTAGTIADMMHNNVIETYGQDRFPGMDICAKSGTAEVGADKSPNAWFTGFLRDEATPYAFIVLVENGGQRAAQRVRQAETQCQTARPRLRHRRSGAARVAARPQNHRTGTAGRPARPVPAVHHSKRAGKRNRSARRPPADAHAAAARQYGLRYLQPAVFRPQRRRECADRRKAHRKAGRDLFGRGTGGCCLVRAAYRRQSRVRIPAGTAVGTARSALARAARAEKNAVRAPERAGGAKRRHGRVPKRRQCGRTCC